MKFRQFIAFWMSVFLGNVAGAQPDWKPACKIFSIQEGLPSSETYFVHQSRLGYMWFCTDRGVVKYDGFQMEVLTTKSGLPDNVIFWIYEDYKGRVWFVSYNGLLSYYDDNLHKVVQYRYNHLISDYIGNNLYSSKTFSVDKQDNVYFSTGNNGILKIDSNGKKQLSVFKKDKITFNLINGSYLSTFNIQVPAIPPKVFEAVIRKNGTFERKILSHQVFTHNMQGGLSELKTINGIRVARVKDCFFDIDHPDKILYFPGATGYYPIDDQLWITTIRGVYRLDDIREKGLSKASVHHLLKGVQASSVFKDSEKGLWFSTLDKGIVYMPNSLVTNRSITMNGEEVDATHIAIDVNKDIFYSNHLGVFRLKDQFPLFTSDYISRNIVARFDDVLLVPRVGYEEPLNLTHRKYWRVPYFYDHFNEKDTSVLICMSLVLRIHRNGEMDTLYDYFSAKKHNKNLHHFFETICSNDQGQIFVGNSKGLFRLKNGVLDNSMFPDVIRKNRVSCVRFSEELGLVIGTRGDGIYTFKDGKITNHITSEKGLVSDQINKILIDKDGATCWVATNSGVSKLLFARKTGVRIHNILNLNGLSTNEVNTICLDGKTVYLATKKGISRFPEDLSFLVNPLNRQVSVKKLTIDGKVIYPKSSYLEVSNHVKMIRVELRSTNYKSLGGQQYKYRLSSDDKWTYGNDGSIDFYDLTSGSYQLELSYYSDNGIWEKPYKILTLNKLPKFTETIWFYLVLILSSFLLGFIFFWIRTVQVNRQRDYKRQIEKLKQKALLAQMNPHFIFNSLNSIQSFLVYNENDLAEKYLQKLSQLIRMTLNNSRESEVTVRQEIDVLTKYIELEKMRFKNRFDFEIIISLNPSELQRHIPPMMIQPFVENAIIHGFKDREIIGKLEVAFKELRENRLVVVVTDNGVGYNSGNKGLNISEHKSYGMQIISERLGLFKEKYGTEFNFEIENLTTEDGKSRGTKVTILVPVFRQEIIKK